MIDGVHNYVHKNILHFVQEAIAFAVGIFDLFGQFFLADGGQLCSKAAGKSSHLLFTLG